ncbi:hypothetical protein EIN_134230 [Entamoeba invadens IP1]|uniref:Rho-GAP domain-containing protein n=1 Tax=Entamoeba invadens IP1 TaxID=370355 RepID=A0A0A1U2V8_ENTIV|nr:hypothetical protein EIN_134230 [Entamoeba invadens IP1]ELP85889.1 hypothetical protein EIN_134230 [Entamoeba invadens IP1]|eukprot:XP_004185235.1 hypothetical protein EIN_134230 [Entamoeba invadens IP1]
MKRIECNTPDDIIEWYTEAEQKLNNQKKLILNLNKALTQITLVSNSLADSLSDVAVQFDAFSNFNEKGFVSDMMRNANNKLKAFKGILLDVKQSFTRAVESLKNTEKNVFPLLTTIKKTAYEMSPKRPLDATAICSIYAYEFMETTLIDMYSISVNISLDLNRLTSTETFTPGELRSMKDFTVPRLREDLKTITKTAVIPISDKSLATLIENEQISQYELPYHILKMFHFLFEVGYATTGIFRLAGRADTVALYAKFPSLIEYTEENSVTIAATIKKFMRDLPEPILPKEGYSILIEAAREYDQQNCDKVTEVTIDNNLVFEDNPHINSIHLGGEKTPRDLFFARIKSVLSRNAIASTVFRYFIELAVKISKGPSLMTPNNLAICLAPCMLHDEKADIRDCGLASMVVEEMINGYEEIFNTKATIFSLMRKNKFADARRGTLISGREKKEFIGMRESLSRSLSPPVELGSEFLMSSKTPKKVDVPRDLTRSCQLPLLPPRPNSMMTGKSVKKARIRREEDEEPMRKPLNRDAKNASKAKTLKECKTPVVSLFQENQWNSIVEEMEAKRRQMAEKRNKALGV